jgi:glycosyltransferase involved in cell wall biosynthesis
MIDFPDRGTASGSAQPAPAAATMQVSLIIPVFNSEASLRRLHRSVAACTTSASYDFEIVYVDDASTDGSLGVLRDLELGAGNIVVIEQSHNRGQAKAVLMGILAARSQIVVTLDDDLQHDPADIPLLLAALERAGGAALVIGVANQLKRPLWRAGTSLCANAVSNLFLARSLPLQLTTFCAFHRQLCAGLDPDSGRNLPLMTALVQAAEATVTLPVHINLSLRGASRYGLASLTRLFLSRSRYYRQTYVLRWLAGVSFLMAVSDALWLMQAALHPVLTTLPAIFTTAVCLALVWLSLEVGREARVPVSGQPIRSE